MENSIKFLQESNTTLASELVPKLLAYGTAAHGLRRIIATVAPGNVASQRVLAKAGMALAHRRQNEDGSTTLVYEWLAPSAASQETPSK